MHQWHEYYGGNQALLDLRLTLQENMHAQYCKYDQETMIKELTCLRTEPTITVLLNGDSIKLPSNTHHYVHRPVQL